ncbi:threonine synthase-like 1 isoform X3 [Crassostrea virginica]|uniref:Threonine synthase-like 1 isoform X3 n=1 Tax=Crassostrea virginica TaxID=6565 RepID=A0A8B8BIY7_CRAVI|nr:threonine synthase-like 1 isoform X3 [Crassostrea virginica]
MLSTLKTSSLWRFLNETKALTSTTLSIKKYQHRRRLNTTTRIFSDRYNIILMGSPGSGKSTVARILAQKLNKPSIDIDNDVLEPMWGVKISEKLKEKGSKYFIEEEGKALMTVKAENSIISLTGSNPLNDQAMRYIASTGYVIFLDYPAKGILQRLHKMKIDRIVGQEIGTPLADILDHRQITYEQAYDIRILCEENESPESVSEKVIVALKVLEEDQGYVSTRQDKNSVNTQERTSLGEILLQGLAPDGGLYVPALQIPILSKGEWSRLVNIGYRDRALRIMERLMNPCDLHPSKLRIFLERAYNSETFDNEKIFPVRHLQDNQFLLELFHGPTASFKDAALQLMPQMFVDALRNNEPLNNSSRYIILVATSGDTGSAVLDGFRRHAEGSGVGVIVLFPEHGISEVQRLQMTAMSGGNVQVLGIEGDFDLCQTMVKKAFQDQNLATWLSENGNFRLRYRNAANSITWGRLLPQIVFQVSAYLDLVEQKVISLGDEVDVCIPTGNFGNILGAYYAQAMGIPFRRLICASNANNTLTEFINTGVYDIRARQIQKTQSPAIDILKASNLERFLYHMSDRNDQLVRKCFKELEENQCFEVSGQLLKDIQKSLVGKWCSEAECVNTIKKCFETTGYLLDPHTAIAKFVADLVNDGDVPMIINATAHCSKFAPQVLRALGHKKEIKDKTVSEMFDMLHKITESPSMHSKLEECVKSSSINEKVLKPNYEDIEREIKIFSHKI